MNRVVDVVNVVTKFGNNVIHDNLNLSVCKNEIYAILGESGSGKSVLMKEMIMLLEPTLGEINVLGYNLNNIRFTDAQLLRSDWGVLFQFGALFSSLTVAQNIEVQLKEYTKMSKDMRDRIVYSKLALVGLDAEVGRQYPSQISGGMVKRVALARALAMEPKILFLDEPTSGLDPIGARNFDELIKELRDLLGITVIMITHDLETVSNIVDKMAIIADRHIVAEGSLSDILESTHPFVKTFFQDLNDKGINDV